MISLVNSTGGIAAVDCHRWFNWSQLHRSLSGSWSSSLRSRNERNWHEAEFWNLISVSPEKQKPWADSFGMCKKEIRCLSNMTSIFCTLWSSILLNSGLTNQQEAQGLCPCCWLSSLHICRKYIPNVEVECGFTPQFLQKFVSDSVLNWEILLNLHNRSRIVLFSLGIPAQSQSSCCAPPLCPLPQALTYIILKSLPCS